MAEMIGAGTLDMSVFRQESYSLDKVNDVLAGIDNRHGGLSKFTIVPTPE